MKKIRLAGTAVVLLLAMGSGTATAGTRLFDSEQASRTTSDEFPRWAAMAATHHLEEPLFAACRAEAADCPSWLKGWTRIAARGRDLTLREKVHLVNKFINMRAWSIEKNTGRPTVDDRWTTPSDFMKLGGDCEDFAIAKYFLLRDMGLAADDMRIVVAWDRGISADHAFLAVRADETANHLYLMDTDQVRDGTASGNSLYRVHYTMNERNIWLHRPQTPVKTVAHNSGDGAL